MIFCIYFTYERNKKGLLSYLKNLVIIACIILKQLLVRTRSIYHFTYGGENIFLNELEHLNKLNVIQKVSKGSFDILSMNRIANTRADMVEYEYKYKPIKLILKLIDESRKNNHTLGATLSVLRSSIKYSFLYDENFSLEQKAILERYQTSLISDPGNPFIRMLSSLSGMDTKYVCTTAIGSHSIEWLNIEEKKIYVVGSANLAKSFKRNFGKNINYITSQEIHINQQNYKYKLLFLHQYYHELAFNNRCTHFIINCKISMKKGVLMRLHPSESIIEKTLYRMLSFNNVINLSNQPMETDFRTCMFAISFSSSALLDFKVRTGRRAKFLSSKHQKWSNG
ncbi:hypothetical protein N8844_03860 [Planktomarina temperata]|nr:hypothetical protein [Planktomarina temperata]